MKRLLIFLLSASTLIASGVYLQQQRTEPAKTEATPLFDTFIDADFQVGPFFWNTRPGIVYLPPSYASNPEKNYRAIWFFHGVGESSEARNNALLLSTGLPELIQAGQVPRAIVDGDTIEYIVFVPQHNSFSFGANGHPDEIGYMLDWAEANYRIDTTGIYATGLSAGGQATVCGVTATEETAERFAAIVPVALTNLGMNLPQEADSIVSIGTRYGVKAWVIRGENDTDVGGVNPFVITDTFVNRYNRFSPSPTAVLTTIQDATHSESTWNVAYDTAFRDHTDNATGKNIYEWFAQYTRSISGPTYIPPPAKVKITITTSATPSAVTLTPTKLKHNKTSAWMLEIDDGPFEAWDVYRHMKYKTFTDGAGKLRPFVGALALNSRTHCNDDLVHENPGSYPGSLLLWKVAEMTKGGWDLLNHGAYHNDSTINIDGPGGCADASFPQRLNIQWNEQYWYRRMGEMGVPFVMNVWVTPSNDEGYNPDADEFGYLGFSTGSGVTDGYTPVNTGSPASLPTNDGTKYVWGREFSDVWNTFLPAFKGQIETMLTTATTTSPKIYRSGSHLNSTSMPYLFEAIDYVESRGDSVWVTTLQELLEHEYMKRVVDPTKVITTSTTTTTIELDYSVVTDKIRHRDMSFLLSVTGASVYTVNVSGVDEFTYNPSTGLLNIYSEKRTGYSRPYGSPRVTDTIPITGDMVVTDAYSKIFNHESYLVNSDFGNFFAFTSAPNSNDTVDIHINFDQYGKKNIQLSSVSVWDANGTATDNPAQLWGVRKYTGEKVLLETFTLENFNAWEHVSISDTSTFSSLFFRKLHFNDVENYSRVMPAKFRAYGSFNRDTVYYASYVPRELPSFEMMIGSNTYWYWTGLPADMTQQRPDYLSRAAEMEFNRLYFDLCQHFYTGDSTWFHYYDSVLKWQWERGVKLSLALKSLPSYDVQAFYPPELWPHPYTDPGASCLNALVPAPYGSDLTDPNNYLKIAKYSFQIAARYGRNTHIDESLRRSKVKYTGGIIEPWQNADAAVWGLGYVTYMSPGNENDKDWEGTNRHYTQKPAEIAAMMSACYDGHKGTMGAGVGIKNADPTMIVLPPAFVTARDDNFMRMMMPWVIANRGYKADGVTPDWPWDMIDFHNYSSDGTGQFSQTIGKSHEQSFAINEVDTMMGASGAFFNSMPMIQSEFGWDTRDTTVGGVWTGTVQNATPYGSKTVLQRQADWTLRKMLIDWSKGMHGLNVYELFDNNPFNYNNDRYSSTGVFWHEEQTIYSGVVGVANKPSGNFLIQAKKLLKGTKPDSTWRNSDSVWFIRGRRGDTTKYVVWVGKQTDASHSVSLPVTSGSRYDFLYTSTEPSHSAISTGGTYTFNATETPVVILVGPGGYVPPSVRYRYIFPLPRNKPYKFKPRS